MIVYKVINSINNKIYIGQTIHSLNYRKSQHISSSKNKNRHHSHLHNALKKNGVDVFIWEIIRICNNIEELNAFEQYYILYYNSVEKGYNLKMGGLNSYHSQETKDKISKKSLAYYKKHLHPMTGKRQSKESIEKMRQSLTGRKLTEQHKKNIGKGQSGKKHWNYGKKHSKETREKMRKNHANIKGKNNPFYGKKHSKETKQKIRIAMLEYLKNKQ